MVVANSVRIRAADAFLDDVFCIVDVLMREARGDLLGSSFSSVVFKRRDRRRALLHFDELIQRIPVVRLRAVGREIPIAVNGSTYVGFGP